MSLVAEFSVPVEAFCLGETLRSVPSTAVELDRIVAHSPDYVMPFVWVLDGDQAVFEDALEADATVVAAEQTDALDGAYLYQMTWADVVSERLQIILDHDGVILEARGTSESWRFGVRFGSHDHFTDFQDHFGGFGKVTLHQLKSPQLPGDVTYGVSEKQRAALLAAYDAGYYEGSGGATGEEIAQELDVTQQAVSKRLQRGISTLLENTLDRHRD